MDSVSENHLEFAESYISCKKYRNEYSYMLTFEKKKKLTIQATLEIFSGAEWRWEWAWLCPWWATCQEDDADHVDHDNHNHNDNGEDCCDDNNDHDDDNVI